MIIVMHTQHTSKLRRSGMCAGALRHLQSSVSPRFYPCRSYGAWLVVRDGRYYKHGAPNGASRVAREDTFKVQSDLRRTLPPCGTVKPSTIPFSNLLPDVETFGCRPP